MQLLLLSLAAIAPSSGPHADLSTFRLPAPNERPVLFDSPGNGALLASGSTWKAAFHGGTVEYVPFFGSATPRNFPVEFSLEGVRLLGEALPLAEEAPATRAGSEITLDHGSTREVWSVAPDHVEQSFVFDELPARGELVVSIDFATELEPVPVEGGALEFFGAYGRVRYGTAIAIDAEGKSTLVPRIDREGGFDLVVPHDFVATAELPLVIDPIVSTISNLPGSANDQSEPDVAFGSDTVGGGLLERWLVVWEERVSSNDIDMFGMLVAPGGVGLTSTLTVIDSSSDRWGDASVAYNAEAGRFSIAATRVRLGRHEIWIRSFDLETTGMSQQIPVAQSSTARNRFPTVCGNETGDSGSRNLVVWLSLPDAGGSDVLGQEVTGFGATVGPVIDVAVGPEIVENPRVARGLGELSSGLRWRNVNWNQQSATGIQAWSKRISHGASASTARRKISLGTEPRYPSPTATLHGPADATGVLPFYSTCADAPENDVQVSIVTNGTTTYVNSVTEAEGMQEPIDTERTRSVSFGHGVLTAYTNVQDDDYELHFSTLTILPQAATSGYRVGVGERRRAVADSITTPENFSVASAYEGGGSGDACAIVWADEGSIFGAIVDPLGSDIQPALGAQFCEASPNSTGERGWMWGSGMPSAQLAKVLHAESLPPSSFGYLLAAPSVGSSTPPGSFGTLCIGGAIGRYVDQVQSASLGGSMSFFIVPSAIPTPLGPRVMQPGEAWHFQTWHRDQQGGQVGSNFTNAIAVAFD